jgi:23S rRNA (adenine2030-N6)-methyltransferase
MLSYQHGYHAGNYADVLKHIALTRLLSYMTQKDKPMFYLETHSGRGLYDLKSKQAEKTSEYKQGIQLIWNNRKKLPPVFQSYIKEIAALNTRDDLKYYPGSPHLAIHQLRHQDRLYFCELHPAEYDALNELPHLTKKVHLSNTDGIAAMRALLPPPEKRGLVFIDPSYEIKEEYRDIPAARKQAFSHFTNGVFCLWYPVVNRRLVDKLVRNMKEINAKNTLRVEFNLTMAPMEGMSGTGLLVINPPYTFAEEMKTVLETLRSYFNPGVSSYIIEAI